MNIPTERCPVCGRFVPLDAAGKLRTHRVLDSTELCDNREPEPRRSTRSAATTTRG